MESRALPSVSIVIEWETGLECGGTRALRCLAEINRQMWEARADFAAAPELILVFDPAPGARAAVEDAAAAAAATRGWPGRFEIAEAPPGCDYYGKKNFGFRRSSGEVAVFVDSDLAPEPEWLRALIAPFAEPGRNVVVGLTHFETTSLYERAMALFWIFEAREPESLVRPTRRLVSNNIAFRRALFAALPFPERATYRGQCSELGATLGRLGIVMHEATAARAAHPAPTGPGAFAARAFRAGRDACAYKLLEGPAGIAECGREWRRDLGSVAARVRARATAIGAGAGSRVAARALGALYYSIKASGYLLRLGQERLRRRAPAPDPHSRPL